MLLVRRDDRTAIMSFLHLCVLMAVLIGVASSVSGQKVKAKWGISDSLVHVGRLCRVHVPSDAFEGQVLSYTVTTAEGLPLPKWLEFNPTDNVLTGIPTRKDIGEIVLKVVAKGEDSEDETLFTITVKDSPSLTSGSSPLKFKKSTTTGAPEFVRCKHDEAETVATIIIDTDMEESPISDTVALLEKFLGHMDLHHDMVRLTPVGTSPLDDSSALVSGPGDCKQQTTAGTFLSWPVGCGQVKEGHFKVLQRLDDDSRSGEMAKVIGRPIIGWRVSNSHLQPLKRKRRQAMVTATPSVTPVQPTKTDTDMGGEKMTRDVPERSSPAIIDATATQPMMSKTADPTDVVMPSRKVEDTSMIAPSLTVTVATTPTKTKELPPVQPTATMTEGQKSVDVEGPVDKGGDYCVHGKGPGVKTGFKRLDFNVGDVIDMEVPADTFEDCEVGGTRGLSLMLFKDKTEKIPSDFFVQFNEKKQKIVGLPLKADIGRYKMNLVGQKDSNGLVASIPFVLAIKGTKNKKKINHELSVSIDYDYDKFMASVEDKTMLANKVASIYGDSDASNLIITKMARGSVVYGWTNRTVSSGNCPVDSIKGMVGKLVNEDGTLSEDAIEKMKPYTLMGAASAPSGPCEGDPDFPAVTSLPRKDVLSTNGSSGEDMSEPEKPVMPVTGTPPEGTTGEKMDKSKDDSGDDDIWVTTVVPAVVIVVILIIALIIACVLYRKKRKGKMNVEEQNTFVNKGAPVIFPDELKDKPSDVNKPLLVEGRPAPPPEYHRGVSESPDPEGGSPSANTNNHRNGPNNTANDDGGITEMPERPYDPPPPVAASSNNSKQPRPTQQPMSQHPQILP